MFQRIKQAKQEESGFSLIELLVVIIILGILAGVVVFAVGGITDRGQESACRADLKTLRVAQEAHFAKTTPASYAASDEALVKAGLLSEASTLYETSLDADTGKPKYTKTGTTCP